MYGELKIYYYLLAQIIVIQRGSLTIDIQVFIRDTDYRGQSGINLWHTSILANGRMMELRLTKEGL